MAFVSVLVVDDDIEASASARAILSSAGYAVCEAANGQRALLRLRMSRPDVLITEIVMADGDGIELITAVKRMHPEVRIIAMSQHRFLDRLDLFRLATMLGAKAVLEKPLEAETLLATVARVAGADAEAG
jgi:DNA-binding NtrC family response regulator